MRQNEDSSDSDSGEDYYLQNSGSKFENSLNEQRNDATDFNDTQNNSKVWKVSDCEQIISSHTNPVGKVTIIR